jgi:hypothetical protein
MPGVVSLPRVEVFELKKLSKLKTVSETICLRILSINLTRDILITFFLFSVTSDEALGSYWSKIILLAYWLAGDIVMVSDWFRVTMIILSWLKLFQRLVVLVLFPPLGL